VRRVINATNLEPPFILKLHGGFGRRDSEREGDLSAR
jgi:hypothetical protein